MKTLLAEKLNDKKLQATVLVIAWILVNLLLLLHFGIVTFYEATKYIEQADNLLQNGSYASQNFIFYSVEIWLIAAVKKLHVGYGAAIAVQLLLNAISTYFFYHVVQRLTAKPAVAFFFTLALLGMFYYQLYNVHLFTESIYFSLSILLATYLFSIQQPRLSVVGVTLFLLAMLCITRPTGVLFIPATVFFFIFRFGKKKALPLFLISVVVGLVLFYFLLNAVLGSGGELDFLLPYTQEHIICGVPTVQQPSNITASAEHNSVAGLWSIVKNNGDLFFRLAKERFVAFWGVRRSFYSSGHNLFVSVYFYGLYLLVLLGVKKMTACYLPQAVFMGTYILLVMLTVLLSCDEWHNRFLYSLLPFLFLLATGPFIKKPVNVSSTGSAK